MSHLDTGIKGAELGDGASRCVTLEGVQVGLFRTADGLFAINNVCPHKGAPLHDGFVHDGAVTCPWHQWDFRLSDGACITVPQVRVAHYGVEEREGAIWVNLEPKAAS